MDGPFSWHGILALWLPFVAFFIWILIMSIVMLRAAKSGGYAIWIARCKVKSARPRWDARKPA